MQTIPLTFGTRKSDPQDDLALARQSFAESDWWERAELEPHWPLNIGEVVQLLNRGAEFDLDEQDLFELHRRRLIPRPGLDDAGEFAFDAFDVVQVASVLFGRRQFKETPSINDSFKHPTQIILEQARESGEVATILEAPGGLPRYDIRDLLERIVGTDNYEARVRLYTLAKVILEVEHGVLIK